MEPIYRDRAIVLGETLVLADLHLGRERAGNVEWAVGVLDSLLDRLGALIQDQDVGEVIVAGDLLEAFDSVAPPVAEAVAAVRDRVAEHGADLIITPGNHDTMLDVVWDGPTHAAYELADGTVVCHGHEQPGTDADRYVIGHDHPAIEIEGRKRPCYLLGPGVYRGADVLVVPAFNGLIAGVTINQMTTEDFHSPLITNAEAFRPIVRDETGGETLTFPPLGSFRGML